MAQRDLEKEKKQWLLERDMEDVKKRLQEINAEISQMKDLKYIPSQWQDVKDKVERIEEQFNDLATKDDLKDTKTSIEEKYDPWLKILIGGIIGLVSLILTAIAKLVLKI